MLTAGSMLKDERTRRGLTLEQVASATKISPTYLSALEQDEYHRFPSAVYARGFLQNYAKYLEVDVEKVIALYRRSVSDSKVISEIKQPAPKVGLPKFVLTPSIFLIIFFAILVITTLGYLIYQFYNFQKPPVLEISKPNNAEVVDTSPIEVVGITDSGMFVTINDEPVKVSSEGAFRAEVGLTKGSNTLIIKARHPDNIGKEAVLTLTVQYEPKSDDDVAGAESSKETPENNPEQDTKVPEPVVPQTINLNVSILEESAWVEVAVDGSQVFASVAPPNSNFSYTAEKVVSIRSGRVASTKVTVNGEEKVLFLESAGVGSIVCEIVEDGVDCREP